MESQPASSIGEEARHGGRPGAKDHGEHVGRVARVDVVAAAAQDTQATAAPPPPSAPSPAHDADTRDRLEQNSIFAEGLGAAIAYSFNYGRILLDQVALRAGFGDLSVTATSGAGPEIARSSSPFFVCPRHRELSRHPLGQARARAERRRDPAARQRRRERPGA